MGLEEWICPSPAVAEIYDSIGQYMIASNTIIMAGIYSKFGTKVKVIEVAVLHGFDGSCYWCTTRHGFLI
jgi:hypothetical protein